MLCKHASVPQIWPVRFPCLFRSFAARPARVHGARIARDHALRLLVQSGIAVVGTRQASLRRPLQPEPSVAEAQAATTRGQTLARSGKTEEALAEFDQGDRARSPQRAGPVQPRPALSGRKAASTCDRRFHRGERPDAAAGRAVAGPRDQLPRAGQGQGSRRRSRRGRAGRSAERADLDYPGACL